MGVPEEADSWCFSFSGAGYLALYYVGVFQCLRQRAPSLLQSVRRFYGSSAGALCAASFLCGVSTDTCCSQLLGMVKFVCSLSLGIFHPAYAPIEHIRQQLQLILPADSHILASQRLGISVTHWPDGQNVIITDFATREELIQALVCTSYFPFYCGTIPPAFRGERYLDGALSNHMPFANCPTTITVSPFHGTADICPQSTSASLHEMNAFNANFQISTTNFFLGFKSLFPFEPEMVADYCRQGYLDALRFLERRGLTKEPVLCTLVSRESLAPAEATHDARRDGGLNWAVPNVLVKDVLDFEQLSPELEAALRQACQRSPRAWARFRRSWPGQALTYLLLPCTLPFEYVYFRSRRLALWLPDAPADLRWIWGQLKGATQDLCSRTGAQFLQPASLLVSSAVDAGPGAAARRDSDSELRATPPACGVQDEATSRTPLP
ncbi:patatin-like phospholipase domain-containing protein 5 [Ctenodactylus gundi]